MDDIHSRMGGELHVAVFDKTATNPKARLGDAIARFCEAAPDVSLNLHVATIGAVERGVMDGRFHVGIIPVHRSSRSLAYTELFDETMLLYCGTGHPLFGRPTGKLSWAQLRAYPFAGLGYHSPNMELSHRARLLRKATGFDQESIATLILSGQFLGFLPDHYAAYFESQKLMQAIEPGRFQYACRFVSLLRRSPEPSRVAQLFEQCLQESHGKA